MTWSPPVPSAVAQLPTTLRQGNQNLWWALGSSKARQLIAYAKMESPCCLHTMQGGCTGMHDTAQDTARRAMQASHLKGCQACLSLLQSTQRLWLRPLCMELCKAALEHVLNLQHDNFGIICMHRHMRQ